MSKTKFSQLPTKATPVLADLVTGLDNEDSDLTTKNKNFTIEKIGDTIFPDKSTTDLVEGTNLYYTDQRVDDSPAVTALENNKEDVSNKSTDIALGTSNTLYPTQNAVKDYVDNNTSIPDATEAIKGKARLATQTEVMNRSDNTTIVTPAKLGCESIVASEVLQSSADTERTENAGVVTKVKQFTIGAYRLGGSIRIKYEGKTSNVVSKASFQLFKNNVQIQSDNLTSLTYQLITYDVNIVEGDELDIRIATQITGEIASLQNARIYYDEVQSSLLTNVDLD